MNKLLQTMAVLLVLAAAGAPGRAQDFPGQRQITLVVPFAAGGPTDKVARDLAEALRKVMGGDANFAVENATGGPGGQLGVSKVVKADPDGYTLLLHHIAMGVFPSLVRNLPFNVETDFEYLGMINEVPMALVGKPQLPARNYGELMAWVQANKGRITLAHAGITSASHLCGMMWRSAVGVDMMTIPYKGTAPAMSDLMRGQVDLMCDQTTTATAPIEAGRVKAFAVTTPARLPLPALRHLPTLAESGLKNFQVTIWHGLYAPRGTPPDVQKKLNDALQLALREPEFVRKQQALGAMPITDRRVEPAEHRRFVQAQIARWRPIIKAAGQYAD